MAEHFPLTDDYLHILRLRLPLMDVRAPVEFGKGAFNRTVNLPLMNDAERAAVGTCYKQHGQQSAIALGHQLVSGALKQQRIEAWLDFTQKYPDGILYCARGGLRSQIVQQWLAEQGVVYPRVKGGFKALRHAALQVIDQAASQPLLLLAGPAGSGKTRLLQQLKMLDLEGLANHRGSAFGQQLTPQPPQVQFENDLAAAILQVRELKADYLLLEDESLLIGQRSIPHRLYQSMQQSPALLLEEPLEKRIEVILHDYITDVLAKASKHHAEKVFSVLSAMLQQGLARISKRLGGALYSELRALLLQALAEQQCSGDTSLHRVWISALLTDYYDPMYRYQLQKRALLVLMQGSARALADWWYSNNKRID